MGQNGDTGDMGSSDDIGSRDTLQRRARRILLQRLESLQRCGLQTLPTAEGSPDDESADQSVDEVTRAADVDDTPTREKVMEAGALDDTGDRETGDRRLQLQTLSQEVQACRLCQELAETRTQTVFGVGNPHARLCFLGEAPGADEDKQGEPFVGRAGRLLTDIIQKGMGLERGDVYILNVLKCRPPQNRNPTPEEATNCRPFLDRQLDIIRPEFICCLGSVAAQTLLDTKQAVGKMRGHFHDYRGIQVLVTYHPAYLLRNPPAKKDTWQDLQILMKAMGISVKS